MELLGDKMGILAFMNLFLVVYKEIARNDQSFPGKKKGKRRQIWILPGETAASIIIRPGGILCPINKLLPLGVGNR
jgi:hypothetical protein